MSLGTFIYLYVSQSLFSHMSLGATYISTYLKAYLVTCLHAPSYICTFLKACLVTCLCGTSHSYICTYLKACLVSLGTHVLVRISKLV